MKIYLIWAQDENGGIGKNVAATAVAQAIKDNFPEHRLVVVTGWPEIWKTKRGSFSRQ